MARYFANVTENRSMGLHSAHSETHCWAEFGLVACEDLLSFGIQSIDESRPTRKSESLR